MPHKDGSDNPPHSAKSKPACHAVDNTTFCVCGVKYIIGCNLPTNSKGFMDMPDRVRAVAGDNVTDELRARALGECVAIADEIDALMEDVRSLKGSLSNKYKQFKGLGLRLEPLKRVLKERRKDPVDVLADLHEETRLRALRNMPTIQTDLMELIGKPLDISADQKEEIARQRWRDDGAFAGREGTARDSNPHLVGSEARQQWDAGWLNSQERIAKAMGTGGAPIVTGKEKPMKGAKNGAGAAKKEAAPKKAAPKKKAAGKKAAAAEAPPAGETIN